MLTLNAEVVNGDHVSMEEPCCRASFLMKSRSHVSLFNQVRPNYFNGNWSLQRLVHTGIHRTHAPAPNAPFQPVAFREDARHVHTDQSGTVLCTHWFAGFETYPAFRAFLKA